MHPQRKQKEQQEVQELMMRADHVRLVGEILPQYAVSEFRRTLKGKRPCGCFSRMKPLGDDMGASPVGERVPVWIR